MTSGGKRAEERFRARGLLDVGVLMAPLQRWIWSDPARCARKLLRFAQTEAAGARDIARAAELTADPLLRRLYRRHAADELRHAEMFRERAIEIRRDNAPATGRRGLFEANWLAPGERGLDDLVVEKMTDAALLQFLHHSETAAARRFAQYARVLQDDVRTRLLFEDVLRDEMFHMSYTKVQLARVNAGPSPATVWRGRASRLWRAYLRGAAAVAGLMGIVLLTVQYFVLLPPFAWLARRSARRQTEGWTHRVRTSGTPLESQA